MIGGKKIPANDQRRNHVEGPGFQLKFPISTTQWVSVTSNKEMTAECFRKLHTVLALQREILIEEESSLVHKETGQKL